MFRAIPEPNRPVRQRELRHARRIHLQHLEDLRPTNQFSVEDQHQTALSQKKKQMLSEDKYTEIERENRILCSKISDIMLQPKHKEPLLPTSTPHNPKAQYKHSLNLQYRRREFQRIEVENAKMLRRLQTKKSPYEAIKLQREWEQKKQVIRNMSSFPVILFDKSAENKPLTSKSYKGYSTKSKLNQTAEFHEQTHISSYSTLQPEHKKSNREIKLTQTLKIDGHTFIVTVRLTSQKLLIQAVLNRKRDELKIIEVRREQALDFIQHECQNTISKIFHKLRFDGQTLYLVADQTKATEALSQQHVKKSRPILQIDTDLNVDIEHSSVRLPSEKRAVASSLQKIEQANEPQAHATKSEWNKATI